MRCLPPPCPHNGLPALVFSESSLTLLSSTHSLFDADDEFQKLTHGFMAKHCEHFEDTPENKLVYTSIFSQYVSEPPHPFLLVRFSCAELPSSLSLPSELSDGAH